MLWLSSRTDTLVKFYLIDFYLIEHSFEQLLILKYLALITYFCQITLFLKSFFIVIIKLFSLYESNYILFLQVWVRDNHFCFVDRTSLILTTFNMNSIISI